MESVRWLIEDTYYETSLRTTKLLYDVFRVAECFMAHKLSVLAQDVLRFPPRLGQVAPVICQSKH